MAVRTATVDASTNQLVYPPGHMLVQKFTAAERATVVPSSSSMLGYEVDTGILYKATGTNAGDWSPTAGGPRAVVSDDGSYMGFYDGATYLGKVQLSAGAL